ncbi:MAG: hypothetical protein E7649_00525 [Ruminococcaceae bacterium]|nr:hypothetical protein [Oscillospiraceae bacterium]
MIISPGAAINYMNQGLSLCATSVIPSLFPFMIISELIVACGIGQRMSKPLSPLTKSLFGIGKSGACAFLLGTLCGFPVGARVAASMYDKGDISPRELERILTFCNNPSPAFIISTVGTSLLGRQDIGILIYACVIISSVAIGIFANIFTKKSGLNTDTDTRGRGYEANSMDAQIFTSAVRSSAASMLVVCAYVVFFTTLVGCVKSLLLSFGIPSVLSSMLFGFFELSSGASSAANIGNLFLSAVACALFSGWSGLSVHFQIMSVTSNAKISYKPYLLSKAAQGIICAALCALALKFAFPSLLTKEAGAILTDIKLFGIDKGLGLCALFFIASLLPLALQTFDKKQNYGKNRKVLDNQ